MIRLATGAMTSTPVARIGSRWNITTSCADHRQELAGVVDHAAGRRLADQAAS
jgi:hypothetical protein